MVRPQLRLFVDSLPAPAAEDPLPNAVHVQLGDIFPVLADALVHGRSWVFDFQDELVAISPDLFEILQAYDRIQQRPSA